MKEERRFEKSAVDMDLEGPSLRKARQVPVNRLSIGIDDVPWALARTLPDPDDGGKHRVVLMVDGATVYDGTLESMSLSLGANPHQIRSRGDGDVLHLTATAPRTPRLKDGHAITICEKIADVFTVACACGEKFERKVAPDDAEALGEEVREWLKAHNATPDDLVV